MSILTFYTPTTLEEPFIFTMGASVKLGNNPIGMFGTGLKYAIAVVLRNGGKFTIITPHKEYGFFAKNENVRGSDISFIYADVYEKGKDTQIVRCPMTTQYGLNWEPWMVMRELYSNTVDEGGAVYDYDWNGGIDAATLQRIPLPENYTRIVVDCPAVYDAWQTKHRYLIDKNRTPLYANMMLQVFHGSNDGIFYRGIRVAKPAKETELTYNILMNTTLTEDRTLDQFTALSRIRYGMQDCEDEHVCRSFIEATCTPETAEHTIDWDYTTLNSFKPIFRTLAQEAYKKHLPDLSNSFRRMVANYNQAENPADVFTACDISDESLRRFNHCRDVLAKAGLHFNGVRFIWTMDTDCYAVVNVQHRIIFMNPKMCFEPDNWETQTCLSLIEEYVHLINGSGDCTRMMQHDYNNLIYKLIKGEIA